MCDCKYSLQSTPCPRLTRRPPPRTYAVLGADVPCVPIQLYAARRHERLHLSRQSQTAQPCTGAGTGDTQFNRTAVATSVHLPYPSPAHEEPSSSWGAPLMNVCYLGPPDLPICTCTCTCT